MLVRTGTELWKSQYVGASRSTVVTKLLQIYGRGWIIRQSIDELTDTSSLRLDSSDAIFDAARRYS